MEAKRLVEIATLVKRIEDKEARRAVRECLDEILLLRSELSIARLGLDAVLKTVNKSR